ncbi:MAG: ABC transporter substrate-binding protein [Proteobacteria bacterium]|nr:ABC transporter substrate-binding protein [Pseudomonadota bacterium]
MQAVNSAMKASVLAIAAIAVLAQGAWAAGCDKAAEVSNITIMGDWLPWSSQGPVMAAQAKGLYQAEGLTVKLISPPNPADPIKLVARQKVEFSMTYPPDIIQARETGIPVQSVGAILRSFPWGLIVTPDIKSPADLKGKTIGASSTQTGRFFLETMIKSAGLDPKKDVTIVAQGYGGVQLFAAGKIQGTTGLGYGELVTVQNARKKAGKSAPGWLDFSDYGVPPFYFMVIAGNEDWMRNNPGATCRFLRATAKGWDEFKANQDTYNQMFAKQNEVFPLAEHAGFTTRTLSEWKAPDGTMFKQSAANWAYTQAWMLDVGLISVGAAPDSFFTNAYLP